MGENWLAFERRLAAAWPPPEWADVTVLVAVSGGPDSVALLRGLVALKTGGRGRLAAGHFNHQVRAEESRADERFVVRLCQGLRVRCAVGKGEAPPPSGAGAGGSESALRMARYAFLESEANRIGARYVVTAHTAEDQAETILHRVLRGSGIAGLAGMPRARTLGPACTLLRPLLGFRRSELVDYLGQIGQPFRSDSSNADCHFTRNRIRHQLLPLLAEEFNPGVIDALLRLGGLAAELNALIDGLVEELFQQRVRGRASGAVQIETGGLADQPRYLLRHLMMAIWRRQGWPRQAMGFAQWERLASMLAPLDPTAARGTLKAVFPGNILAESFEGWIRLSPQER